MSSENEEKLTDKEKSTDKEESAMSLLEFNVEIKLEPEETIAERIKLNP